MLKIFLAVFITAAVSIGGYLGYQEISKSDKVETAQGKEQEVKLDIIEVKDLLRTSLDSIFNVFVEAGEINGWNNSNPSDFSKIRPDVLLYATEEFSESTLKELSKKFYCECDQSFKPSINYDVQFLFEQNQSELKITALDPATEISNMGSVWEFELIKEENTWKMNQWNVQSLEGQDIQLTIEEAEKILTSEHEKPEFVKEYESQEAAGKAYLFKMNSSNGDRLAAISSKNTRLVSDFEDSATQSNEQIKPEPEAVPVQIEESEEQTQNKLSTKADYLSKLALTETQERRNEYQSDYQMAEDYGFNYQLWDVVLNEIYAELKVQLSESEMTNLRNEQRNWIQTRDATAQARYDEEGGGSMSSMVKVETLAQLTKERCYELVNLYMK
jgi:uncharacterized protein YecT (DUF1311 family)